MATYISNMHCFSTHNSLSPLLVFSPHPGFPINFVANSRFSVAQSNFGSGFPHHWYRWKCYSILFCILVQHKYIPLSGLQIAYLTSPLTNAHKVCFSWSESFTFELSHGCLGHMIPALRGTLMCTSISQKFKRHSMPI